MIKYLPFSYRKYKSLTKGAKKVFPCAFCKKSPNLKLTHKMIYVYFTTSTDTDDFVVFIPRFCNENCFNCFVLSPTKGNSRFFLFALSVKNEFRRIKWHN